MKHKKHRSKFIKEYERDKSKNPSIVFYPDEYDATEAFGNQPIVFRLVNKNRRRYVMSRKAEKLTYPNMSANERFWKSLSRIWGDDNGEEND